MARTGSSAVTRLLNLVGVDLGPEEGLLPPVQHINSKGFYENRAIMQLNDELLARLGGTWQDPPLLAPGWAEETRFDDLRAQGREVLAQTFTSPGAWGFKDPRTCFTLPFWRPLIGDAHHIICHRNPLEVARSLERRDGLKLTHGLALWTRYASSAALATAGATRLVVGYEELFHRPEEVLRGLAAFIGQPERATEPDVLAAAQSWIESDLKHHQSTVVEVLAHPDIAPDVRTLHLAYELAFRARRGTQLDESAELALDAAAEAVDRRLSRRGGGTRKPVETVTPPGGRDEPPSDLALTLAADIDDDLDFLVLGALPEPVVRMLAAHPAVQLDEQRGDGVRGAVRPGYVTGAANLPIEEIAYRIGAGRPGLRLILALEEPVAQAIELHRRAVARGLEHRSADRALREQLWPAALAAARNQPRPPTGYLVAGECGRIAETYLAHLPASQALVVTTGELAHDALAAASRVASFLGIEDVWPEAGLAAPEARLRAPLDRALDDKLREHFAADGERLREALGVRVWWAARIPSPRRRVLREDPAVAMIVIVHDTPEDAAALLDSVRRHTPHPHEVMVIDNGSSPEAELGIKQLARSRDAGYRRLDTNEHFGRACNYAVRRTKADEILLINSDCVLTAGALENMRAALASAPEVAAVGPRSNSAHAAQGGIWLDDTSPEGIERFARFFNYHDPERWFEVDWLIGFALLIKRSAYDAVGGFNGKIRTGAGEDRDLCRRLREAGHKLLCAGDTFVFHWGQRTYDVAGVNRTALRFGHKAAGGDANASTQEARLLRRRDGGRTYEVAAGTAWHVESSVGLRLIRGGRPVKDVEDKQIDRLAVGPPICLVRAAGTDQVFVLHAGTRRPVTGDRHRIRRLPGLSLTEPERLDWLPLGPPVAVEDAIAPVPELASLLPDNPAAIRPERLTGAGEIADAAAAALRGGEGFSLIRLGTREAAVLNEGAWDVAGVERVLDRIKPDDPDARALRDAIVGADAVAVPDRRDSFPFAPLVEQLLFHLDLYPPRLASWNVGYELLGIDPETGRGGGEAPLMALLAGAPVAVVGPLGPDAARYAPDLGLDVRVVLELTRGSQIERVLGELAAVRDAYDVVLVAAGPPGRVLCSRAARELGAVALDLGHALDRLLYVRHGIVRGVEIAARWQAEQYLREALQPPPDPPHPLEGQLVRVPGERGQYLVERGRARHVTHRLLSAMFGDRPHDVDPGTFAQLLPGMPLAAVHDRRTGLHLLLGGRRVPLRMGIRAAAVDDLPLQALPVEEAALDWFPGADPPAVRHTNTSPR